MELDFQFLSAVCAIVKDAGVLVERIAKAGFNTDYKEGMDPVTTADIKANKYLQTHLLGLLPETGWLSEETKDQKSRLSKKYVWIV